MHELLAVDNGDIAVGTGFGTAILIISGLGVWIRNLIKDRNQLKIDSNKAAQEIAVSQGEERRKDNAITNAQDLTLLEQATKRIDDLEKRDEEKNKRLNDCEVDRASLRKEVEWLNKFVGKPAKQPESGEHRPLTTTMEQGDEL